MRVFTRQRKVPIVRNIALRSAGRAVDRQPDAAAEQPASYVFVAVTNDEQEAHVRALLVQALTRTDFRLLAPYFPPAPGLDVVPTTHPELDSGSSPHDAAHYLTKKSVGRIIAESLS